MNQHYHTPLEDFLVKYLLQEASPEEIRTVEQWLDADPANRQYFDDIRLIWEKSLRVNTLEEKEGEEEQAWQDLKGKLHRSKIHTLRWVVAAAAVLLPIALISMLWQQLNKKTAWQETATLDAIKTDTLADGSIVTLNKHSSLSQPSTFNTKERTVTLKGEAFFKIAPDKDRPFHVQTNGIAITVLGTSFNVRTENDRLAITVETGLIEVKNAQTSIRVKAGETITLGKNDPRPQTHLSENTLYKYYQPRDFVCHDTRLGDLVNALNQAYGDSITIGDPSISQLPINTTFHNEPLSTVLNVIAVTLNIKVQQTGNSYILEKK